MEQRAKVEAGIIVAKLLYVARHAWTTTTMAAKLSKLIKNYVWHGYFGELDGRCTTWLNERVAGLACKEGGLAIANLKAEIMAMAAVTAGRWSMSAKTDLLSGDILMASADSIHTETTMCMMGHTARSFSAFRSGQSVWSVGKRMLGEHGFSQPSDTHVNAVSEFYKIVDAAIPDDIRWAQGTCSIDVSTLHGPRLYALRTFISQTYEDTTVNWLPHLEIKFVWLLNEVGRPIHTTKHWVPALSHGPIGKHIKWIKSSRTRLTFVAKTLKKTTIGSVLY